jgi:purine-binding chemotaxis protein CheW
VTGPAGGGPAADWDRARARLAASAAALEAAARLSPEQQRELLERRARDLSREPPAPRAEGEQLEVLIFRLGSERYGVETSFVVQVLEPGEITSVPGAPPELVGVTNLRGSILGVFDLRPILGLDASARREEPRLVVLGKGAPDLGVLVDAAEGVVRLSLDELSAVRGQGPGAHVRGMTPEAVVVLDAAVLMVDGRLSVGAAGPESNEPARSQP